MNKHATLPIPRLVPVLILALLAPACVAEHRGGDRDLTCAPGYGHFKAGSWPPGCWRPYAASSPFNTPLPPNPRLVGNSARIVARVLGDISPGSPGHEADGTKPQNLTVATSGNSGEPTYYAQPTDPVFTLHCSDIPWGADGSCELEGRRIRIPAGARREGGAAAPDNDDRHMTIIDQSSGWEYDLWQVKEVKPRGASRPTPLQLLPNDGALPKEGGDLYFTWGGRARVTDGDGTAHKQAMPAGRYAGGATASEFASLAGRIRIEELESNRIDHALTIVINCDSGAAPVYPATKSGRPCSDLGLSNVDAPPMGSRFALDMTAEEIDLLPQDQFPAWKKTILRAAAEYGMFFGDTGTDGYFALETESGAQYTSVGHPDRWLKFAQTNNWAFYRPAKSYIGDLSGHLDDAGFGQDIWKRLVVIHPCVSEGTCQAQ